jgi:hypothetical protein
MGNGCTLLRSKVSKHEFLLTCMCSLLNSTVDRSECCVSGILNWSFNYCMLLKQKLQINDTDVNIQLVVSRSFYYV